MTERPRRWGSRLDDDLDGALIDLGRHIEYPPTPDLVSRLRSASALSAAHRVRLGWPIPDGLRPFSWALLAALLTLLLVAGAVIAIGLGLRGLGLLVVDELPKAGEGLQLGERVTLREAQARVPFPIALPNSELGDPEVFVDVLGPVEQVNLVYRGDGDVALLLTQFEARPDMQVATKLIGLDATIEDLTVSGSRAYWIEGEPHALAYLDRNGTLLEDRVRLVGNVLAWQEGEVTMRLEGVSNKADAVRIAEAMG